MMVSMRSLGRGGPMLFLPCKCVFGREVFRMLTYSQAMAQPMLSPAEEIELFGRWLGNRNVVARDKIVATHMRICYATAARFAKNDAWINDLAQEGSIGLLKAIDKFDPELGYRFSTYASWWIEASVRNHIHIVSTVLTIPSRVYL